MKAFIAENPKDASFILHVYHSEQGCECVIKWLQSDPSLQYLGKLAYREGV